MDKYFMNIERPCSCGIVHYCPVDVYSGKGALNKLSDVVREMKAECVYLISDENTRAAAGKRAEAIMEAEGVRYSSFCFSSSPHPDEAAVGQARENCPAEVDLIIGVGSGVINDIGKLISREKNTKYVIVATAPSMDGYASSSSSMTVSGLKVSLPSKTPDVIIGDTEVLATAPEKMLVSGVGDMLAKYVGLAEWRIGEIVRGEYFCEKIYAFMKEATDGVTEAVNTYGIGSEEVIEPVFRGLIAAGFAMSYANSTRPASGADHYISHIYDMRGAAFGTHTEMHGIQAALGTFICLELYERLRGITPDREKALKWAGSFDLRGWQEELKELLGERAASVMIELEEREGKYSVAEHARRLEIIISRWGEILSVIEGLPSLDKMREFYNKIGLPTSPDEAGLDGSILPTVISATRDIRDKYVISRLIFDLGLTGEI